MRNLSDLASVLKELTESLRDVQPGWYQFFYEQLEKLEAMPSTTPEDYYNYLRLLESANGGMGSFNDVPPLPEKAEQAKLKLWHTVAAHLREAWQEIGNPLVDAEKIELLPIGSHVQFVPGKIRYINRDGSKKIVPHAKWVKEQVFRIEAHYEPDISNMPQYSLVQGSKHLLVRHESVKLAKNSFWSRMKQLLSKPN